MIQKQSTSGILETTNVSNIYSLNGSGGETSASVIGAGGDVAGHTHSRLNGGINRRWPMARGYRRNYAVATSSDALPLAEAARQELAANPGKTPVSILQELLSRRGTTPNYELVQIEGAIHEPTFRFRVSVGELLGFGRSKKEAKHAAAKNILDLIMGNPVSQDESLLTALATKKTENSNDDQIPGNPIGRLQELCMSRRWPPPFYDLAQEEGLPHERHFTMACVVNRLRQVGSGKSKKIAKRQAAFKMLDHLSETSEVTETNEDEDRYAPLKAHKIPTLSAPNSLKVSQFHASLKGSTGVKLSLLQVTALNKADFNPYAFLQELAGEQKFEVTFVDIEELSVDGKCQCLVQLSTMPVAVCYGSGKTAKMAQQSAALNALQYLRIMTKK